MAATRYQYFACLLTLFLFALVSTNTLNSSLQDSNPKNAPLTQTRLIKAQSQFQQFQKEFNKNYATEDEKQRRFQIFQENMKMIEKFNELEKGTAKYGVTEDADLTEEEFQASYNGLTFEPDSKIRNALLKADIPDIALPESFDWRHYNVVTPVRHQGNCGSCWAFSVTGQIESLYAIQNGTLSYLSPQQLIDCNQEGGGCGGGSFIVAYNSIVKMGGLALDSNYSYVARRQECKLDKRQVQVKISSFDIIDSDETAMAKWIVQNGPVSAVLNAKMLSSYEGGVSHPDKLECDPEKINHGIIIVGFGVERDSWNKTVPYWIIKNSYGPKRGEQGYYRLYRGDNSCGIASFVTTAVLGNPPPEPSHGNRFFEIRQYGLMIFLTILSIVHTF